jgi:hypothetical protein
MINRRKRRRLIVRRGREETEEEPLLLSVVCVMNIVSFPRKEHAREEHPGHDLVFY